MAWIHLVVSIVFLGIGSSLAVPWDVLTHLDQYVQSDDGHYKWTEVASYNYQGVTLYIINMTSQQYQSDLFSTRPIWWHIMGVAIPDVINHPEGGILIIGGGSNEDYDVPDRNELLGLGSVAAANDTGIITGYITRVPNQPTQFYADPEFRRRSEDSIIGWTWRYFLDSAEPSDPTIIERMPMTKAAKRGLDTIAAVAKQRAPETNVDKFIVLGASKRGWTTWSLAATDRRVVAQIPLVFSMLNFEGGTLLQHNQNLDGGWSFAFEPYWNLNLTQEFYNPKTARVWEVEDMYVYRERFTIPTLAMSSTGDEFFLLDDNHHWWNDIPANPKLLMMLPNAEHTMAPHYRQIYETAISFALNVFEQNTFPTVTWTMGSTPTGGYITLVTDTHPEVVKAYVATTLNNDTRRDFRLATGDGEDVRIHPVLWRQNLTITEEIPGQYHVEVENDPEGEWTGFFIEAEFVGPTGFPMTFTSQVNIVPNTFPRPICTDAVSCYGYLV